MFKEVYADSALIDTSALIALCDPSEKLHPEMSSYFRMNGHLSWFCLNATAHEAFTTTRYGTGDLTEALHRYGMLHDPPFQLLSFCEEDEQNALELLVKYRHHDLSFHDALCAAVMKREGIATIFSTDPHFFCFGFYLVPGITLPRKP